MTSYARPYVDRRPSRAQKNSDQFAPERPMHTEDPNARAPKDRTVLDYGTADDKQLPEPQGFVPSAPDPVPVYLVQTAPSRRSMTRRTAGNITLAANAVQQVAGVDTRRTRVWLRNLDTTNNVWIMNDGTSLPVFGVILEPGQDVELHDTDELWLRAGSATVDVTWALEYEVDE